MSTPEASPAVGYKLIKPYITPLAAFLDDDSVTEIMRNGDGTVWVERCGRLHRAHAEVSEQQVLTAINHIAGLLNINLRETPILDARLPDRSRVAGMRAGYGAVGGSCLTIRKFYFHQFALAELVDTIPPELASILLDIVHGDPPRNLLISGATGAGKTTVLNALAGTIPAEQRICTIEETAELQLNHPNVVRFEERATDPPIQMRGLLKAALRHRPDRIIVGEVRGAEAWEFLQAMNTGHEGTMCTIHANAAAMALPRLAGLVLQAGLQMSIDQVLWSVSQVIHFALHLRRLRDGRRVAVELRQVTGCDGRSVLTKPVWGGV